MFVLKSTHEAACQELRKQRRDMEQARNGARTEAQRAIERAERLQGQVLILQALIDAKLAHLPPHAPPPPP